MMAAAAGAALGGAAMGMIGSLGSAGITADAQKAMQKRAIGQANYLRGRLEGDLTKAGLPSYLAYIQPDRSLLEMRQVRGLNYNTVYRQNELGPRSGIWSGIRDAPSNN